ncbi:MAG: hypothetical protein RIT28_1886, partial [Pseudomonadota bacterium]
MSRSFVSLLILAVFAPNAHAEPVEARALAQSRWRAPSL